jgi:DNA-binding transcriptional regulator LsrR (DeoR family)
MAKDSAELDELSTIRKLLVLALLRSGMTQAELGGALGMHRTQVGRMFPKGALAEIGGKKEKKGVEGN